MSRPLACKTVPKFLEIQTSCGPILGVYPLAQLWQVCYNLCMNDNLTELGMRLNEARRARGERRVMRRGTLAEELGVTRQTLNSWMTGRSRPSPLALRRMALVFTIEEMRAVHEALRLEAVEAVEAVEDDTEN